MGMREDSIGIIASAARGSGAQTAELAGEEGRGDEDVQGRGDQSQDCRDVCPNRAGPALGRA
jgi:hypothetical protein